MYTSVDFIFLLVTTQEFMLELTEHQGQVGNVLQEGNQMIVDGQLSADEEAETQGQMALLNNRWEELRVQAMDKQSTWVLQPVTTTGGGRRLYMARWGSGW